MRNPPKIEPPIWQVPVCPDMTTTTVKLRVITPMFGGGYEPGVVDDVNPIRAAAIRGHLRYWWRMTAVTQLESSYRLFAAEERIWGSASACGKVAVGATVTDGGESRRASQLSPASDARLGPQGGIFTFPFRAQKGASTPERSAAVGIRFSLLLRYPLEIGQQIETCLRSWLAFGGVGARTRRGCGALQVEEDVEKWAPPADSASRAAWLASLWHGSAADERHVGRPLSGAALVVGDAAGPKDCWNHLGLFWSRVRKGHVGDFEYSPVSGGRWSDYGVLSEYRDRNRAGSVSMSKPSLGLPIEYGKFGENRKGESFSGSVSPYDTGRMASPVILKPMTCADKRSYPIVLVLANTGSPDSLSINGSGPSPFTVSRPAEEQVLRELGAASPLDLVLRAAEMHLGEKSLIREVIP